MISVIVASGTLLLLNAAAASEALTTCASAASKCSFAVQSQNLQSVSHRRMREEHCLLEAPRLVHRSDSDVYAPDLRALSKIKMNYANALVPVTKRKKGSLSAPEHVCLNESCNECFDASAWLSEFAKQQTWSNYSQGDQDAVLASLFSEPTLGTTNRYFVEFGFPNYTFEGSNGNGRNLRENFGFSKFLLLDGSFENSDINLHKRFLTPTNIIQIFDELAVPLEPDYVSVDVDSCDLWLFFALTSKYRPRVMTVEYNSNYRFDDYTTLRCRNPEDYVWQEDNIYGASLSAIELAAQRRGYALVYVTPDLDLFLIRQDLLCEGTLPPVKAFAAATNRVMHQSYEGGWTSQNNLLMDFRAWLDSGAVRLR